MLIFDADGLIKLNRSGVLEPIIQNYESLIPDAVYDEVVLKGAANGYEDAAIIGKIVEEYGAVTGLETELDSTEFGHLITGLGVGETQALRLALRLRREAPIISDDRRFLGILSDLSIPFLIPSHVILGLVRDEVLSVADSISALNALRPLIRQSDYLEALGALGE